MATFSAIDAARAPRPPAGPNRLAARMRDYEGYILAVRKGQVGKLEPSNDDTVRSVALRITRAGKRLDRTVQTWVVDGAVYFRLD